MENIIIEDQGFISQLFNNLERYANIIRDEFKVDLNLYEEGLTVTGNKDFVKKATKLIKDLYNSYNLNNNLTEQQVRYFINMTKNGNTLEFDTSINNVIIHNFKGKPIKPKTFGQNKYVNLIEQNDIVFGIGPAGTGKTYLAMAMAIKAYKNQEVERIVLTRPAVEAGESLGFLPGDLQEKIDPYLRPIYDSLFDILGFEQYNKMFERGLIEVAPLAYMRGRTLDNSYIVLDEAQNTTNEQMKMFLTRIGYGSKAIITGDITQVDLPRGKSSGLRNASRILKNIKGIEFMEFQTSDVVRHPLVQKIINAYEQNKLERKNDNTNRQ